jgi:hypothetical protein
MSRLNIGDTVPDVRLMLASDGAIEETSLFGLFEGKRGLVVHTYVLDFTGG